MRGFQLNDQSTFDDYLKFLQSYLAVTNPAKQEDRKWAQQDFIQASNLLAQWRNTPLAEEKAPADLNAAAEEPRVKVALGSKMAADLGSVFDANLLREWNDQPDCLFPDESPLVSVNGYVETVAVQIFRHWIENNIFEEVNQFIRNILLPRVKEAWKANSCGGHLQGVLSQAINFKFVELIKSQRDEGNSEKIQKYLNKLWSENELLTEITDVLQTITVAILGLLKGKSCDMEVVEQESLRALIYFWMHGKDQGKFPSIIINLPGNDLVLENSENFWVRCNGSLDELVASQVSDLISEPEKKEHEDLFLHQALNTFFTGPFKESDAGDLFPIFMKMAQTLRAKAFSSESAISEKALWDVFQRQVVSCVRMAYRDGLLQGKTLRWMRENDIPELLAVMNGLRDVMLPPLSFLIRGDFLARQNDADYLSRLQRSLGKINSIEVCGKPGLEILPASFQSVLKESAGALTQKIHAVSALPLEYKIGNLRVFAAVYDEIEKQRRQLVPHYPLERRSNRFTHNVIEFLESIESRDAEFAQELKFFLDEIVNVEDCDAVIEALEEEIGKWQDDGAQKPFFKNLDTQFDRGILERWEVLPKALRLWFEMCLKPEGPAITALFSAWLSRENTENWDDSVTESFLSVLKERIISKSADEAVWKPFWNLTGGQFLSEFIDTEPFQSVLRGCLKKAWDEETLEPTISEALGDQFIQLYKQRSSKLKMQKAETELLREEAAQNLLMLWILAENDEEGTPDRIRTELFEALVNFSRAIVFEFLENPENQAILNSFMERIIREHYTPGSPLFEKGSHAREFLEKLFIEHFYSEAGAKLVAVPLQSFAIQALRYAYQEDDSEGSIPVFEWPIENDFPFLREFIIFLRNYRDDLFNHLNMISPATMIRYFPELDAAQQMLKHLITLNQTTPEEVRELKLKAFEHLSQQELVEFVKRFPNLEILDVSGMEFETRELSDLYKAASRPHTLRYRNAPNFPIIVMSGSSLWSTHNTVFDIVRFDGVRSLDLSGSAFETISGTSEVLEVLILDASPNVRELSLDTPELRELSVSACTSLPYSVMEQYSYRTVFRADRVPHINIDMLCAAYPVLEPFREALQKLDEDVQRKLHAYLGLAFSSFAIIEPVEDETRQLKAIFNFIFDQIHGEPIDKNSDLHALVTLLNSLWMHMRLSLGDEGWEEDYLMIFDAAVKALIQYASSENYDPVLAAQLFFQLGGRERVTDSLRHHYQNPTESGNALGIARLLGFTDVNRDDVKLMLWGLFHSRVHSEVTARLLVQGDDMNSDRLQEFCSIILRDYNECVDALALAVLKYPAAENRVKEVFSVSYPSEGFAALKEPNTEVFITALKTLVRAGQANKAHWNFLANLAQERHPYREKILRELFQAENIYTSASTVIWQVVRRECDWDWDLRLAALLTLPLVSLEDKCGTELVAALDYCPEDIFFRGEILRRLGELGTTNEDIILKIIQKSWPPGSIRKYLEENLTENDVGYLMHLQSRVNLVYPSEDINNTILVILEFLLKIYYKVRADFKLEYLPTGNPTKYSEWMVRMDKMIKKFLFTPSHFLSRVITVVDAMPGSLEVYLHELACAQVQCFTSELTEAVLNFNRRKDDYLEVGGLPSDESRPEPKVIKVASDPFPHLSPLLDFARSKVRRVECHTQIQATGVERLRTIFYGLDYYSYNTSSVKPLPVNSESLLNWMRANFAFCNAQVITWWRVFVNEVFPDVVKIKKNKRHLQAPVVLWNLNHGPEEATIVIPADNKTCVYQFSKQYDPKITVEFEKYFDIDETHCITLPYQNPDEFGWWFFYVAFMTLHTKSVAHLNLFPSRESINALRFFFPEIAEPEFKISAAERPFFKNRRPSKEKEEMEEDEAAELSFDSLEDSDLSL